MDLYTIDTRLKDFAGQVVYPGDPDYDRRRAVWNAMHDRRPALIVRCTCPRDVVAAVEYGRAEGMQIADARGRPQHARSQHVRRRHRDRPAPDERRARRWARPARRGAGRRAARRARSRYPRHGLVVPAGVVSHTGVGGLTLGDGVGRLMRRFGLTIDSLLAAEVITADGRILRVSEEENADLFWGIRGGGGNFGVVAEFEFAPHELRELLILATFHPFERAPEVLALGRRAMADDAPDELLWTSFLRKAPPLPWIPPRLVGQAGVMSLIEWSGEPAEGRRRLEALHGALEPVAGSLEPVAFLQIQTLTDQIFAAGKRTYIKAGFAGGLTDPLIEALCRCGEEVGSPFSQIEVLALGGAIRRVAPEATAFPHRDADWLINLPATWESPDSDADEIAWVRRSSAMLEPHLTGGKYVNFMGEDERADSGGAYGATLRRLQRLKRAYDADNVFRLNQNIVP